MPNTPDFFFQIDPQGTLKTVAKTLSKMPQQVEKAQRRAMRKLMTWLKRAVLRAAAKAAGTTQKVMRKNLRYDPVLSKDRKGISIWVGTNPLKAHRLGVVRWTRRMKGARAGRRLFEGAWSWGPGSKTGRAIMERLGDERLPIEVVTVEIHDAVDRAIRQLLPEINSRFETIMLQELNFAINVEAGP